MPAHTHFLPLVITLAIACGGKEVASDVNDAGGSQSERPAASSTDAAPVDPSLDAKAFFVSRVYPTLKVQCASCHDGHGGGGSIILGADAETSYERLEATVGLITAPRRSPLIQHVHLDVAATLDTQLRSLLTQWLDLETKARSGSR